MPMGPPDDICAKAYAVAANRAETASVVFQGNFDIRSLFHCAPFALVSAHPQGTYDQDHMRLESTIFSPLRLISPDRSSVASVR